MIYVRVFKDHINSQWFYYCSYLSKAIVSMLPVERLSNELLLQFQILLAFCCYEVIQIFSEFYNPNLRQLYLQIKIFYYFILNIFFCLKSFTVEEYLECESLKLLLDRRVFCRIFEWFSLWSRPWRLFILQFWDIPQEIVEDENGWTKLEN